MSADVTLVQDGLAHRPYRYLTDGERIVLACRPEGSQPIDLFDVVLLQTVGPLRRCQDCYLDSDMLTTVCDRHSTWGRVGESASCQQCADDPKVVVQGQAADPGTSDAWKKILREAMAQSGQDYSSISSMLDYSSISSMVPKPDQVFKLETVQGSIDLTMSKEASHSMRDLLMGERMRLQSPSTRGIATFNFTTDA